MAGTHSLFCLSGDPGSHTYNERLLHVPLPLRFITIFEVFSLFLNVCVHVCAHVSVSACECRSPWRPELSDSLELKLQIVVSPLTWVLGTDLGSSGRSVNSPNQ